jgi:transcription elongation factor Elf1
VPFDPHGYDEDDLDSKDVGGRERRFKDFDCPVCNANNPYDDAFGDGDEIRCFYCGQEFEVRVTDAGRLKLRET